MVTKAEKEQLKYDSDRTNLDMDEIAPLLKRIIDGLPEQPEPYELRAGNKPSCVCCSHLSKCHLLPSCLKPSEGQKMLTKSEKEVKLEPAPPRTRSVRKKEEEDFFKSGK